MAKTDEQYMTELVSALLTSDIDVGANESDSLEWTGTDMDAVTLTISKGMVTLKQSLKSTNTSLDDAALNKLVMRYIDTFILATQMRSYNVPDIKNLDNEVKVKLALVTTAFSIKYTKARPGNKDVTPQRFVMVFAPRVALIRDKMSIPVVADSALVEAAFKGGLHPALMFSGGASLCLDATQLSAFNLFSIGFAKLLKDSKKGTLDDKDYENVLKFNKTAFENSAYMSQKVTVQAKLTKVTDITKYYQTKGSTVSAEDIAAFKKIVAGHITK